MIYGGRREPLKQLQLFVTAVWGILTPALALDGAQQVLLRMGSGAEAQGQSALMEYGLYLAGIACACVLAFLLFNFLFSVFALPKDGRRFIRFVVNLLLYIALVPAGWFLVSVVVPAIGL